MKFEFIMSKEACFYYWVQAISGWNIYFPEEKSYEYFKRTSGAFSDEQKASLEKIAGTLVLSSKPRLVLAELYSNQVNGDDAKLIYNNAAILKSNFESIWPKIEADLLLARNRLENINFTQFTISLQQIAAFLGATFNEGKSVKVYLLQNAPEAPPIGHKIECTDFILLHPEMRSTVDKDNATVGTLLHELIHSIEFGSELANGLTRRAYSEVIEPLNKSHPKGMTWRMVYAEVIVYCFMNNITGGYLRPEVFDKPRPKAEDMKKEFYQLVANKSQKDTDIIAWVALSIQADVELYLTKKKTFDISIANKISKLLLQYF